MAITFSNPATPAGAPSHMTQDTALRYAWSAYTLMLLVPFLLFIALIWSALYSNATPDQSLAWGWFIGSMVYIAIGVPAAIFWRSHVFQSYWKGVPVAPSAYLSGMLALWIALEIGGILSLVGCLVSNTFMPGLIPAATAFVLFTPLWPSGRAMLDHHGISDDPSQYSEPH